MVGLLDGLFNSGQYSGLLGDVQRWQRTPEQVQQAFEQPTGHYQFGGQMVPVFGQGSQMEMSAQARVPQPPQAPQVPAPQVAPQAPTQEPGLSAADRFKAATGGFMTNAHTGPLGALMGAVSGFATGDYDGGSNQTVKALMARGLDRDMARAAVKNPQIMAALVPTLFGTRKGENINNRLVDPTTGRVIADFSDSAKPVALGNDQRLVNPTTGQQVVGPAQVAKFDDISGMRKEVSGLPEVKRVSEALPIFRSMVQSHGKDSSAADLDYVYGVAKIFDPDSVVREGEMKLVGSAQSLPEDVKGFIKRVAMGEGRLTPEARLRILEVANTRMTELKGAYDQRVGAYNEIATRHNIRPDDVLPKLQDMPQIPQAPKAGSAPIKVNSLAEAAKLPKRTRFTDPNGIERIR